MLAEPTRMKSKRFQLDPETLKLIQVIESTEDESARHRAIMELAAKGGMNSARILIETFERSVWRDTKIAIIQALGLVRHGRSLEFLCRLASDPNDYGLASEAVLSLGALDHPVGGEFLASLLRTPNHPLTREALTALANQNFFPCEPEIATILDDKTADLPPAVRQNAVIAAGLRGYRRFLVPISSMVQSKQVGPLFNTAMMALGRIGDRSSLEMLEHLDTRYRSFAHQLKLAALDHLRLSATYTVEDAVQAILIAKSPTALKQAWIVLGSFSQESAREALQILASEGDAVLKTLERAFLFDPKKLHEDLRFLADQAVDFPLGVFAALGRLHSLHQPSNVMIAALRKISDDFFIRFTACVRLDKAWSDLVGIVAETGATMANRQNALNSLIAQHLMSGMGSETKELIGKQLIRVLESMDHPELSSRVIRAIGQLRYCGPDALNILRDRLKGGIQPEASYAALVMCESEDAIRIITKRLRQILPVAESAGEVRMAIHSLARSEGACDASCLAQISPDALDEMRVAILKILTLSPAKEMQDFIALRLRDGDFQARLLAVAAAKHHQSDEVAESLFEYLDHPNHALAGRALDSLVTSFGSKEHLRVFERMRSRSGDEVLFKKVFRSLKPREGESYKGVLTCLDVLIRERKGVMTDQDMVQAALNLRDNLVVMTAMAAVDTADSLKAKLKEVDRHAIDASLGKELRGFEKYSATIKSVLRSGEVTWQNPELFDARVDKSTVLVQYVKAIDLLLQEKIGSQMFLGQGANFLQKMQSRVIRLELDEESSWDSQIVGSLDCSMHFSRDSFPTHKLMGICRSIMTGQIMKEQYKVVDGLRAWAILLLLFGRSFKFRGQAMDSLFPMLKSSNDGVCRIARAMNDLQEARNRAAHRGTVLEKDNIKELRDLSAALLNDLDQHFNAAT
jgi:HEAT repeat protein